MKTNAVKVIAVGDLFMGEHPFTLGHGVATIAKKEGSDFFFEKIISHLSDGDIICGNLEGIISPKHSSETGIKYAIFWGEPESAEAIKKAGFNCLFLANNHTAQHGKDALKRTCELLDKHNIKWTGFNYSSANESTEACFNIRGNRVVLLSYCETQQYNLDTPILPIIDISRITRDINKVRKIADIIIISLHWGDEFIECPSPAQIKTAHEIIDAGAHLILGHHSHSMQGIEQYKHGLIAYSLGSFIKDLWRRELRESIILSCNITKDGISGFNYVPIYINDEYQPEIYTGKASEEFVKNLDKLSGELQGTILKNSLLRHETYKKKVIQLARSDKVDNLRHYMKNIFRYDKRLLLDNAILMLKRRIYKKNI
jgi:poly-gamma-glutamate synthesis protein (capsule biosynthesis protein)